VVVQSIPNGVDFDFVLKQNKKRRGPTGKQCHTKTMKRMKSYKSQR
jgi:hypothetical protein